MQVIKITCPSCGRQYTLKTGNAQSLAGRQFKCKHCGSMVSFNRVLGGAANPATANSAMHTHIAGGVQQAGGKTTVHGVGQKITLRVDSTGRTFSVGSGLYIMGRECSDTKATLPIAPDPYMSRQHARLQVMITPVTTQCLLIPLNSQNVIFINDRMVPAGQQVILKNGDRILLGMTTVTINI